MANFLVIGSYSPDGVKGVLKSGATARVDAASKAIQGLGGKVHSFHFAFGGDDAYLIVELPDNVAAAALSLAVSSTGLVSVKTIVLLTRQRSTKPPSVRSRTRHRASSEGIQGVRRSRSGRRRRALAI
jgi:uncharacterized protein with GYD domain